MILAQCRPDDDSHYVTVSSDVMHGQYVSCSCGAIGASLSLIRSPKQTERIRVMNMLQAGR